MVARSYSTLVANRHIRTNSVSRRRLVHLKATNIQWDVDETECDVDLPTEIDIPDGIVDIDEVSDYLSDFTGFCHRGFSITGE